MGGSITQPGAVAAAVDTGLVGITPQNFRHWRAAVARVRAGTGFASVACYGDSTTQGAGGTSRPNVESYPTLLRGLLNSYFAPAAEGIIWALARLPVDGRWTLGGGWTRVTGLGPGISSGIEGAAGAVGVLALAPGFAFDRFRVLYIRNAGHGSTTVNVDGGASLGTIAANGAAAVLSSPTYEVALGQHTINLSGPTGGALYVLGIEAWDSTRPAVRVSNGGAAAQGSASWVSDTSPFDSLNTAFNLAKPDLTILCLTINDAANSVPVATWRARMATLIDRARANNGDVLLVSGVPIDSAAYVGGDVRQAEYSAELVTLAGEKDCGFSDLFKRWESYAKSNEVGLYAAGDNLHPSPQGYGDVAQLIHDVVTDI